MSVWVDRSRLSTQTDVVELRELSDRVRSQDPSVALRAVSALRRLAQQVEGLAVARARERGWSWEQIGDALGVSRQSVHAKYGK
jgi:hypothetical protein